MKKQFLLTLIFCMLSTLGQAEIISNLELRCSGLVTIQLDDQSKETLIENYRLSIENNFLKGTDVKLLASKEWIKPVRKNIKTNLMGGNDVMLNTLLIDRKTGTLDFQMEILEPSILDPKVSSASAHYQLDCMQLHTNKKTF